MRWKYAWEELRLHPVMIVLILIQTLIVFTVTIAMVSVVISRSAKYQEVRDLLSGEGEVVDAEYLCKKDGNFVQTVDDAAQNLPYVEAAAMYDWMFAIEGDDQDVLMKGYDDALWQCHTPEMAAGRWLQESDKETEELEVVIAQSNAENGKYQVGDVLYGTQDLSQPSDDSVTPGLTPKYEQVVLKVVGIVKNGASLVGREEASPDTEDYRSLFWNYYDSFETSMYIFGVQSDLYRYKMNHTAAWFTKLGGEAVLRWDTTDPEKISDNQEYLMKNASLVEKTEFSTMRTKSEAYIFEQIKTLLPVLVTLVCMTVLSTVCNMAILMRQSLRHYAVYYVHGLSWRDCCGLQVRANILLEAGVFLVTFGIVLVCEQAGLLQGTVISVGMWQVLCCLALSIFFCMLSLLVTVRQVKNKSAKDVLREEEKG